MFLDLTGIVWDLGSQKMWGTCLCVFWTLWGYFFGPACICAGPGDFCFLDPCTCFVDLASTGRGELHCYRRSHWAGCFWCERLEERNAFLIFSTFLSSPLTLGVGLGWGGVGVITSCTLAYYMTCYAVLRSCTLAAHMYCHAGYVANTSASGVGLSCTLA